MGNRHYQHSCDWLTAKSSDNFGSWSKENLDSWILIPLKINLAGVQVCQHCVDSPSNESIALVISLQVWHAGSRDGEQGSIL